MEILAWRLILNTEGCCEGALLKRMLLLGLLVCLFGRGSPAAEDKPIAIVHARLIDGIGGPPLENATVIVRGRTVEYAGPAGGTTVPNDAQVIDATGKTVMPGLSDMHVHLQGAWDGISVDLFGILAIPERAVICRNHDSNGYRQLSAMDTPVAARTGCWAPDGAANLLRGGDDRFSGPRLA
jgi:Amidohydrolase family